MLKLTSRGRITQPCLKPRPLRMASLLCKLAYLAAIAAALSSISVLSSQAATINVPAGQPTIQGAINAASNGDTVLVAPGTYRENINFVGKAITVTSSGGPAVTTINGGGNGPVVLFVSGEGAGSVLSGFTITNGNSNISATPQDWNADGGGIVVFNAAPMITGNVITQNVACSWGGGIYVGSNLFPGPSPVIAGNQITENVVNDGCSGGGGGGIAVTTTGSTQITGNTISGNSVVPGNAGGGIYLYGVTTPIVENNVITNNSAIFSGGQGGGICIVPDGSNAVTTNIQIIQNLIFGNTADNGGGIYVGSGYGSVIFTSNTIADNNGSYGGSGVFLGVYFAATQYYNNLIIGAPGESALYGTCQGASVTMLNNDLLAPGASGIQTSGCDVTGSLTTNGNLSANPLFLDGTSDFHLQYSSPAVGVGDSSAPNLPSTDLDGNPRLVNGKIDMGAYELQPTTVTLTPTSLAFAAQVVGNSSSAQSVTLTNTGNQSLRLAMILGPNFTETDDCGTSVAAGANCTINVTFVPTSVGPIAGSLTLFDNASDNPQRVGLSGTGTGPA